MSEKTYNDGIWAVMNELKALATVVYADAKQYEGRAVFTVEHQRLVAKGNIIDDCYQIAADLLEP